MRTRGDPADATLHSVGTVPGQPRAAPEVPVVEDRHLGLTIIMTPDRIEHWNAELRDRSPIEIARWAVAQAPGATIVSTNFRPYEAVPLHLASQALPGIPVLWVDHGYNRPATYEHAEDLRNRLGLNIHAFLPRMTAAHRDAIHGPIPELDDEEGLKQFRRADEARAFSTRHPRAGAQVWITGLRRVQNPGRAELDIVSHDANFGTLKVSPAFHLTDPR